MDALRNWRSKEFFDFVPYSIKKQRRMRPIRKVVRFDDFAQFSTALMIAEKLGKVDEMDSRGRREAGNGQRSGFILLSYQYMQSYNDKLLFLVLLDNPNW